MPFNIESIKKKRHQGVRTLQRFGFDFDFKADTFTNFRVHDISPLPLAMYRDSLFCFL